MKNKLDLAYLVGCVAICSVPLLGMAVRPTTQTTEKRALAEMPELNIDYLGNFGKYFEDHFAFKNELVAADGIIQTKLFQTSSIDTVVKGTDGWLYYSSTLDDYLGQNIVSEQEAYNIARNIRTIQERVEQEGCEFVFTVPANKNTLYDDNMPYYYRTKASDASNMELITPKLKALGVNYVDLIGEFRNQSEVLYRKQDSHWNQKGAVLAYNKIMDSLNRPHEDYSKTEVSRSRKNIGDLANSLYSVAAVGDWDYTYKYEQNHRLTSQTGEEDWEEPWIEAEADEKLGQLLMFRDSFGNTLSPLLAEEFRQSAFSKDTVYFMDKYLEQCSPNVVIVEIVERNIKNFSKSPPIMTGPVVDLSAVDIEEFDFGKIRINAEVAPQINVEASERDSQYMTIQGQLEAESSNIATNIYVEIQGKDDIYYRAFGVGENGYLLYIKGRQLEDGCRIRVITEQNGEYKVVAETQYNKSGGI